MKSPEQKPEKETLEQKIERLRPIFERSIEEGLMLTVTRELEGGKIETISDLITLEINEDGPELAFVDEEGNSTASATMLWKEIIDAKE
jgi:hypothetical protein